MRAVFLALYSVVIGSTFIVSSQQSEHHEIPIISNNSVINNSFAITSFINFTKLLNIDDDKDLEGEESYDDGVALMDDYIEEEESTQDDDGHNLTRTSEDSSERDDEDDSDFEFLATRGRWSYAPGFVERMCRKECQANGKPFGRLLGVKCQCYCPLNAPTLELCSTTRACDSYCSSIGYSRGGDCVYNNVCFCYCKKSDPYDVSHVYTE